MKKILLFGCLILLGAACAQTTTSNSTPQPTRTPTPTITMTPTPNPAQILSKAGDAMLAMKSARFSLIREGDPVTFDPTTGMAFSEATGDYLAPESVRAAVKVTLFGNVLEIEIYWLPDGVYISNPLTQQFQPAPFGPRLRRGGVVPGRRHARGPQDRHSKSRTNRQRGDRRRRDNSHHRESRRRGPGAADGGRAAERHDVSGGRVGGHRHFHPRPHAHY